MMNLNYKDIIGIPSSLTAYLFERAPKRLLSHQHYDAQPFASDQNGGERASIMSRKNKIGEHATLGPKLTETVKGKLSLGARILQAGGVKKVFKKNFSVTEEEKLLKASQCYLSTTAGPMAGLLFVSTDKVAFCSDKSIKISSPSGKFLRIRYKVVIPLRKIKRANASENLKKPSQKYIQLVTEDNFEFWFTGSLNRQKTLTCLKQAINEVQSLPA